MEGELGPDLAACRGDAVSQYTLYHGDCLDILPTLDAGSVDAVITDPPYGTTACKWDSVIPFEPMWRELKRVIKPRGAIVLFSQEPYASYLRMSNIDAYRYDWVWDKKNSSGYLNANRQPMRRHELIVVFSDDAPAYYPVMRKGVLRIKGGMKTPSQVWGKHNSTKKVSDEYYPTSIIEISNANRSEKVHPTQKPLALLKYLIKTYTNDGDTVLDFTMGSGTTGHACANTGRRFIGIEKDAGYFEIARARIAAAYDPLAEMVA